MSKQTTEFEPDVALPPGETLLEAIEERGMTQSELADRAGRPRKTINEIIRGKAEITSETALQLERVLGIPARFWINRESLYRESLARWAERMRLSGEAGILTRATVTAMAKLGWIRRHDDRADQTGEVLNFFGVASPLAFQEWAEAKECAFRRNVTRPLETNTVLAWIRKGELEAHCIRTQQFSPERFRSCLAQIRNLTREPINVSSVEAREACASAGVALVFVPELPGMRTWGVTQWINTEKAIIQLSLRYKTDDHLWFTFFHEACHILKHGKRRVFLELDDTDNDDEAEANRFAADFLIPPQEMSILHQNRRWSRAKIDDWARRLQIAPGILVGRLQHENILPRTHLNCLKRRLEFALNGPYHFGDFLGDTSHLDAGPR